MTNADSLTDLRDRAIAVQSRIAQNQHTRPRFIEFSGSPKSGKSTCIDIVGHFFRRLKFNVLAPTEGASKRTPYYLRDDLVAFNTWSACYALTHVLEGLYDRDRYDLAILDRGLFDALVWFERLAANGDITTEDRDIIHRFLLFHKWRSVVDIVFLFTANPATSMERENREKLITETGRAMNPEFLQSLNAAYDSVHERYVGQYPRIERIDTSEGSGMTPQATAYKVVDAILNLLESSRQ